MRTILIVFHSLTGGTRQMAEAAARGGATEASIQIRLLEASKAGAADVLHADGYIFATPENLAAMAGIMKDFFDRTYYAALDRIRGRPVFPLSSTSLWEIDPLAGKSDVSRSVASRSGWRYHAGTAARGRRPLAEENPPGHASEVVPDTRHKHEYQPEVIAGMENVEDVCGRPIYTSDDKVGLSREYLRRFKSKNLPGATAAFLFVSSLSISPNRDDSRQ